MVAAKVEVALTYTVGCKWQHSHFTDPLVTLHKGI